MRPDDKSKQQGQKTYDPKQQQQQQQQRQQQQQQKRPPQGPFQKQEDQKR